MLFFPYWNSAFLYDVVDKIIYNQRIISNPFRRVEADDFMLNVETFHEMRIYIIYRVIIQRHWGVSHVQTDRLYDTVTEFTFSSNQRFNVIDNWSFDKLTLRYHTTCAGVNKHILWQMWLKIIRFRYELLLQ